MWFIEFNADIRRIGNFIINPPCTIMSSNSIIYFKFEEEILEGYFFGLLLVIELLHKNLKKEIFKTTHSGIRKDGYAFNL